MKKTHCILLIMLLSFNLFSQHLSCETILKNSVDDVYSELFKEKYSIEEVECFGERLAKFDIQSGIKRILTLDGPFTTGCLKCIYSKFGFETVVLGSNDFLDYNSIRFLDSYNRVMDSSLNPKQKLEIENCTSKSNDIFTGFLTTKNHYELKMVNDSIVNLKIYSDSLESLFKLDIANLIIGIGDKINDSNYKEFSYFEFKAKGINIVINANLTKKLFVCYDFRNMPNRYDLCWCNILDQKYNMIIPLKIK